MRRKCRGPTGNGSRIGPANSFMPCGLRRQAIRSGGLMELHTHSDRCSGISAFALAAVGPQAAEKDLRFVKKAARLRGNDERTAASGFWMGEM